MGGRRHSIWGSNGVSINFRFSGGRAPRLNRDWLALLAISADSARGLSIVAEPTETVRVDEPEDEEVPVAP